MGKNHRVRKLKCPLCGNMRRRSGEEACEDCLQLMALYVLVQEMKIKRRKNDGFSNYIKRDNRTFGRRDRDARGDSDCRI